MKTSIVQIGFRSDAPGSTIVDLPQPKRAGTGFFVSPQGYVLTAGHVIRSVENEERSRGATKVVFAAGILIDPSSPPGVTFVGSFSWTQATIVDIDDSHDVALLKLSQNPFDTRLRIGIEVGGNNLPFKVSTARLDSHLPPEGMNLLVSGYPLQIPTLVTQKGMVASESYSEVEVPGPRGRLMVINSILFDAVVNPGNSGGPVYEPETGDVIGICDAYEMSPIFTSKERSVQLTPGELLTQNSGLAVVVPIEYAIQLLRKNAVPDFSATEDPSRMKPAGAVHQQP